jgi:hypothetical protein
MNDCKMEQKNKKILKKTLWFFQGRKKLLYREVRSEEVPFELNFDK